MKKTVKKLLENKEKTVPILSFPSTQMLGITVKELLEIPEMQVKGMKTIAESCNIGASLNMMDLSVEAEAFGAELQFRDDDVPSVRKGIIDDIFDAEGIVVPPVGSGRTAVCIEGVRKSKQEIQLFSPIMLTVKPYAQRL